MTSVDIVGLAYDFCVQYSALDAAALGYDVKVYRNMCRAIDLNGSEAEATESMKTAQVEIL